MASPSAVAHPSEAFWIEANYLTRRIFVGGELDAATSSALAELAAYLQEPSAGPLVIDLKAVSFIDARALGVLVRIANEQRSRGASLRIIGNPDVARVAKLGGLDSLLTPTDQAGVHAYGAGC